jgi:mono/diheme cytochrome c family protein
MGSGNGGDDASTLAHPARDFPGGSDRRPASAGGPGAARLASQRQPVRAPRLGGTIGEAARDASLARRADGIANPIAPGDEGALLAGMTLYRDNCAGCHGGLHGPSGWGSGGFYPRVPQFWQEDHGHVTPAEAFVAIRDGIRYSGMGAWRGMMSEAEIWQVANFVSRIHALPPNVDARWRAGPARQ